MNVSWMAYDAAIAKLVEQIKDSNVKLKYVTGIPRGGLPVATSLSHALNLQYIDFPPYPSSVPPLTLVCDDIADSGQTLLDTMSLFMSENGRVPKTIYSAVLFQRKTSKFEANFSGFKLGHHEWLRFPWE